MKVRILLILAAIGWCATTLTAENWPQWRGPMLNGLSRETNLPVRWSKTEGLAWTLPLPAWSGSTPIVWGDRIFLNVADGFTLALWCVDRTSGAVLWRRPIGGGNKQVRKQNMSSPSPVTDGTHVWVMTGTGVFKAFDFSGNERWARDLQREYGAFGQLYGYGSSPLLFEDSLYVQVLHGSHHLRAVVSDAREQGGWQDALASRAAHASTRRIARRVYDADSASVRRTHRNRRHGRRRRHRS